MIFIIKIITLLTSGIFVFLYMLSWIKFQKYQFLERDYNIVANHQEYSRKWHFWKGLNQLLFFYFVMLIGGWQLALVHMVIYWIAFDGWLNIEVLDREFFYVGRTSFIDKTLQKISSLTHIDADKVSFILKLTLLITALKIYF